MRRAVGNAVLGLSACGYPLTQLAVRRWGVRGAALAEAVYAGLAIRDASMVAGGALSRLRAIPAVLLHLELAAAVVASLAGIRPLLNAQPAGQASPARADTADMVRRAAVATLFTLHTMRFRIYLRPGQGRRAALAPDASPSAPRSTGRRQR
jgi:hypothetical protein